MQHTSITVDGETYFLENGPEADTVRARTLDAVRRGGALVELLLRGGRRITLPFAPGMSVVLGRIDLDDEPGGTGHHIGPLDIDLDLPPMAWGGTV